MKYSYWKIVMVAALTFMMLGVAVSLWGINHQSTNTVLAGLAVVVTVCFSWWFWVMMIIKTMIKVTDSTVEKLTDIKQDLSQVKVLLKEYDQFR